MVRGRDGIRRCGRLEDFRDFARLVQTAAAGQAVLVASYPVLGMTAPVTVGAALAQMLAEVLAGAALTQLVKPGAPVMVGMSGAVFSMRAMRPEFGGVGGVFLMGAGAQLARDLGCPVRGDGAVTSSKLPDAQASGDATRGLACAHAAGVDFALHSAGWLEAGLVMSLERFADDIDAIAAVRPQGMDAPAQAPGRGWETVMADWREQPMDASMAQALSDFVAERSRRRLAEAAS